LHEERHSKAFSQQGGILEMIQLWVNLPAKDKMSPPHYQEIVNAQIPVVVLPNQAGSARIIAGQFGDTVGAARTFTPINLWDVRFNEPIAGYGPFVMNTQAEINTAMNDFNAGRF
jgi:redox-sensitive bicupin YhaK (pirin superfamily)